VKIVVNARFLTQPITGVQRYGIEISLQLKTLLGDQIVFVTPRNIVHIDIAKQLQTEVVGKRTGHAWEQLDLPKYLKANGSPLLLNLANTAPIFYNNKVSTLHDVAFLAYPETYSKKFLWFYCFLIPLVLKTSKHIITVSNFSKKEIQRYFHIDENKISVAYNAVNNEFSYQKNEELSQHKYFLAVSSLNHRKNFIFILKVFLEIKEAYPDYYLYIIGDLKNGNFGNLDIERYRKDARIKFLGRVSDQELIRYYSNAFSFLYPSIYEGFGIPPLEAQACNCPVIVSETSSLPEVFDDSALYCSPTSIESLKEEIVKLISSPALRNILIEKGAENVNRFRWSQSAQIIRNLLQIFLK